MRNEADDGRLQKVNGLWWFFLLRRGYEFNDLCASKQATKKEIVVATVLPNEFIKNGTRRVFFNLLVMPLSHLYLKLSKDWNNGFVLFWGCG